MGVYIYSLRKKSKECDLQGITPVKVISFDYAYKIFGGWEPSREYKALVGRTEANADRAAQHHLDHALNEWGTFDRPFYVVWGGFEEGNPVYETEPGYLPTTQDDTRALLNAKIIGTLFKVGRRWVIQEKCPDHKWKYDGVAMGDFRLSGGWRSMIPARSCQRCGKFEYADPAIQAEYEEHQKGKAA